MAVGSQVPQGGRGDDVLSLPSQTSEGLDTIIAQDIFPKATMHVDSQHSQHYYREHATSITRILSIGLPWIIGLLICNLGQIDETICAEYRP